MAALASQAAPSALERARGAAAQARVPIGAAVLAAAVPLLFLHEIYQPSAAVTAGGTSLDVSLADLAVAVIVAAAVVAGVREGWAPLARGRWIWLAGGALCVLALASVSWPVLRGDPYDWRLRLVAALGFVEYALLAPAVPLLARNARGVQVVLVSLVLTSVAATGWGLLQFAGVVDQFVGHRPGQREPSFVGYHDLSALSGLVLVIALVAILTRARVVPGRLTLVAGISGACGMVLAGALTGVAGLILAAVTLAIVCRRAHAAGGRALASVALIVLVVAAGTVAMRGEAIEKFAEFVGLRAQEDAGQVESYAQRTVLGYIGLRIFLDHPIVGAGFQASNDAFAYGPHLDAARARFPDQPAEAFPSPDHPWGVQNLPIAVLADWGLVGLVLLLALFAAGLRVGLRRAGPTVALVGSGGILVAAGVWNGLGVVPAIPLAAVTWLAFGMVAVDD